MTSHFTFKNNQGIYFPLFNTKGLRASITPTLGGDLKIDHHHYAMEPTTEVDLYHPHFSRNVIFRINKEMYFLNGQTETPQADLLEASYDPFVQKIKRSNVLYDMHVTSFIPQDGMVECHLVTYTNKSSEVQKVDITTAVPLYGRSADNLRDHRHVTSLLNQVKVVEGGMILKPTLSFDERGHQVNDTFYSVYVSSNDMKVKGYIPTTHDLMNGGSLYFPKGLDELKSVGYEINGYEALGGIQFEEVELNPHQSLSFIMTIGIHQSEKHIELDKRFLNQEVFNQSLTDTIAFFNRYQDGLKIEMTDHKTTNQLSWVVLQPMLRRYFGNSYLPHHDYGRGGRGWRDLWQDLLALIMMNDSSVIELLYNNFAGIRMDGTNATIIGDQPGEFKADRNMITRVWSDHGAWPLLTTKLYLDETGDLDFLLKKQSYFMDQFTHFTHQTRTYASPKQVDAKGQVYEGTVLEHLLLQNLVGFKNVGQHGFVRLEDADWNDGLDMAHHLGETISFTHMYTANLEVLAQLISKLEVSHIEIFKELGLLLEEKNQLNHYFDLVADFKGETILINKQDLISKLEHLYDLGIKHLHKNGFKGDVYQSYFNNDGNDVDSKDTLNLTGQTMALLNETATQDQAKKIAVKTKEMLYVKDQGGCRLNSDYKKVLTNMGRAYGFAYGHKENGAVFSHMAVMYAYGLYRYNLVQYGHEAMMTLLKKAQDPSSHVLLGIPEYFNDRGFGMYPYLTGSASWMILLIRKEVFGITFDQGKLKLNPKLDQTDFIDGRASITTYINGKLKKVTYHNPKGLSFGKYQIHSIIETETSIEVKLDEIL
ncbi:MAG TPA: cellobiose phosphorylase [Acholeplasmataceae bacterium]|nr:cellobiose phosphorylase [Acholeplasmataceae bacterium]